MCSYRDDSMKKKKGSEALLHILWLLQDVFLAVTSSGSMRGGMALMPTLTTKIISGDVVQILAYMELWSE